MWALVEYDRTRIEAQRTAGRATQIAHELDRSLQYIEHAMRIGAAGMRLRPRMDDTGWANVADHLELPGLTQGVVSGLGFAPEVPLARASSFRRGDPPDPVRHARHP